MQESMLERYARLPIDSPRPIILVVVLITLIAVPSLLKVEFATDVQAFLPQSKEVETYDKISDQFGKESSVVNLYVTPSVGDNILTMQNLADILVLHQQSSEIDGVEDVLSVAGFFATQKERFQKTSRLLSLQLMAKLSKLLKKVIRCYRMITIQGLVYF